MPQEHPHTKEPTVIEPNEPYPMTTNIGPNESKTPSTPLLVVTLAAIAYAIAYRLAPEWTIPNLSPIGAICLYSLAFYPARWGFLLPLGVMVATDLTLFQWYGWSPFNLPVYLCFAMYGLAGLAWRTRPGMLRLAFGTVGSGLVFFIVTNFVVWLGARRALLALFDAIVPALYREASAQSAKEDASKFVLSNDSLEVYSSLEIILVFEFSKDALSCRQFYMPR